MTLREQILQSAITLLNTSKPSGVPDTVRSSLDGILPATLPKILAYFVSDEVVRYIGMVGGPPALAIRQLELKFEVKTKGTSSTTPDQEADALAAWITTTLSGRSQNGLYHLISEKRTVWHFDVAENDFAMLDVQIVVDYQTKASDLSTWA